VPKLPKPPVTIPTPTVSTPSVTVPTLPAAQPASLTKARRRAEVLPGVRLLPTPGHTPGHQSVLVDTPDGLIIIGGDVAYTFDELESGATEGQRRVLALSAPTWLTHTEGGPNVPRPN
jgi:glyoxylase-like metal-dependent hydrolase (beta-lactamase superfamily II)